MAACSKYMNRFRSALLYRGLPVPQDIINYMGKRATSDRSLDAIIFGVLNIIEPPYCQKSHCPSHTTYAFCGCSKGLVPGKCSLNLEYLKRKREREEKILNDRIAQVPQSFLPLDKDTIERIKNMRQEDWEKQIKKIKKQKRANEQ
jgi:hypothetical protein